MIAYKRGDKCKQIVASRTEFDIHEILATDLWFLVKDLRSIYGICGLYALPDELCLQVTNITNAKYILNQVQHPFLYWSYRKEHAEDGEVATSEGWSLTVKAPVVIQNSIGTINMDFVDFSFCGFPIIFELVTADCNVDGEKP